MDHELHELKLTDTELSLRAYFDKLNMTTRR